MLGRHAFQSAKSDGGDATLVRPSDWNAIHEALGHIPAGHWLRGNIIQLSTTTAGLAVGRLYATPIFVPRPRSFDRIAINITTANAGSARLGIYLPDANLEPAGLLLDAGTVDTGTTGERTVTISQSLDHGLYWLVVLSDATPTLSFINATTMPLFRGASTLTGAGTAWFIRSPDPGFGALPDPFGTPAAQIGAGPLIGLRAA